MRGVNKVILLGLLGKNPEIRTFPDGGAICNVSLATSETWKDKQTGEKREAVEWHNLSVSGPLADVFAKYLHKGSKIYVEGSLKTRKWTDKSGTDRYTTEIRVSEMQMLDGKPDGDLPDAQNQQKHVQASRGSQQTNAATNVGDFDDDFTIPF